MKRTLLALICLTLASPVQVLAGGSLFGTPINPASTNAVGEDDSGSGGTGGTVIAPVAVPPVSTTTTTTTPGTTTPGASSINPAANTGQQSQNGGAGANSAIGAALMAAGAAMMANPQTQPMGMALMAMGLAALMQAAADNGAANQSGNTAANSSDSTITPPVTSSQTSTTPGVVPTTDPGTAAVLDTPGAKAAIQAIEAAGGTVTPEGITTPSGTSVPWSSLSSAGSMNAAGLDGTGAMKVASDIEKKLDTGDRVSGVPIADGGGGGGGGSGSGAANVAELQLPTFKNPFAVNPDMKAKLAAGKTVLTASGDPIGVKADDLFAMIHRVYTRKQQSADFLGPSGKSVNSPMVGWPTDRQPASSGMVGHH